MQIISLTWPNFKIIKKLYLFTDSHHIGAQLVLQKTAHIIFYHLTTDVGHL